MGQRIGAFTSIIGQHLNDLIPGLLIHTPLQLVDDTRSESKHFDTNDSDQIDQPTQEGTAPQNHPNDDSELPPNEDDTDEVPSGIDEIDGIPGIVYGRVSRGAQTPDDEDDNSDGSDEDSIKRQIEELEQLAKQQDIAHFDEGETVTKINDDGLRKASNAQSELGNFTREDNHQAETDDKDDRPIGLIYARVSSTGQLSDDEDDNSDGPDEGSIKGQVEELQQLADKQRIALPYEPIVNEAETGTDFDRDGIRKTFHICRQENVNYLFTGKVNRIGRNATETIYFIYLLQTECDVTLLTPSGERDVDQVEGLL